MMKALEVRQWVMHVHKIIQAFVEHDSKNGSVATVDMGKVW